MPNQVFFVIGSVIAVLTVFWGHWTKKGREKTLRRSSSAPVEYFSVFFWHLLMLFMAIGIQVMISLYFSPTAGDLSVTKMHPGILFLILGYAPAYLLTYVKRAVIQESL